MSERELLRQVFGKPGAAEGLRALDRRGRLTSLLPELAVLKGVAQPPEHYWDVFDHSLATVAAVEAVAGQTGGDGTPLLRAPAGLELKAHLARAVADDWARLPLLKLAALLHDIAKPATKSTQPNGRMRFFHHASEGAVLAGGIMARLGFGALASALVVKLVRYHLRPGQLGGDPYPTPRALDRFFRDLGDATPDLLLLNLADHLAMRGPLLEAAEWWPHRRYNEYLLDEYARVQERQQTRRLVDGHKLMAALGLPPGRRLGQLLRAVHAAEEKGTIATPQEAIAMAAALLQADTDGASLT